MNTGENLNTENKETIGLKPIVISYLHHWKLFLVVFLITSVLASLYLIFSPKIYEVMARGQIREDKGMGSGGFGLGEAAGLMKSFGLGGVTGSAINMDDELLKFKSNSLLSKMVTTLGVNVHYFKPYAYKYYMYDHVPLVLKADSITEQTLNEYVNFHVDIDSKGVVHIETEEKGKEKKFTFDSLPAKIEVLQGTFFLTSLKSDISSLSMDIEYQPVSWTAESLAEQFTIEEYSKLSNVIELVCQDYERNRGVDMLNTLMLIYNEDEYEFKKIEGEKSIAFLDERIQTVMRDLSDAERKIEIYKTKNKITTIEYDVQFYVEQMKDLQVKIVELEAQSHVINLLDSYTRNIENKYNLIPSLLSTSETGDKGNPISLYNQALLERERILQSSKNNNPLIEQNERQVEQLRSSVFLSIANARKSLDFTLADLKAKEKIILDKMGMVPVLEKDYLEFKRQQEIFQAVFLILLQKKEEIALSIGDKHDRLRIIDSAFVKENPVGPHKLLVVLAVLFFTLFIPVVYLFIKEQYVSLREEFLKSKNTK